MIIVPPPERGGQLQASAEMQRPHAHVARKAHQIQICCDADASMCMWCEDAPESVDSLVRRGGGVQSCMYPRFDWGGCECWVLDPLDRRPGQSGPGPQERECTFCELRLHFSRVHPVLVACDPCDEPWCFVIFPGSYRSPEVFWPRRSFPGPVQNGVSTSPSSGR